jgi:hypothetical protein
MKQRPLSRRTVLRGAAGISVALPFLEALRPSVSVAQASLAPKRFGVFFGPNGVISANWKPTGGATDFVLSAALQPLAQHRDDLVVLGGIDVETSYMQSGNPHDLAMAHMLTAMRMKVNSTGRGGHVINGTAGGRSIDQAIAAGIGGGTKLKSLELGVESTTSVLEPMVLRMSYAGPDDPRTPLDEPKQAFVRLFGDTSVAQTEIEKLHKKRASVLDAVLGEFRAVDATLGYDDRQRLERHASAIRDLENQLSSLGGSDKALCKAPPAPTVTAELVDCVVNEHSATPMNAKCLASFEEIGKAQMDLMVLAFACDLSRVVTLQWSTAESTTVHSHAGVTGEHHRMSHDLGTYGDQLKKVDTWFAEQFAYLLSEMKKVDEGDKTLLDNSLIFFPNELSQGESHDRRDMPYLLAGKAGGQLQTGRYVKYDGEPHNKLYTTFLNMFGIDAKGFGEADYPGTLSGLV